MERLQKILSLAGIASRREAEKMIVSGRVAVNGTVITELGAKAEPGRDRVTVDGREIELPKSRIYLLLNKPAGYMTTLKDPQGRAVVTELLTGITERVYPVGRLDYNTEGLLLLTNDGEWANRLMHPRHQVEKEYRVRVRGRVDQEQLRRLAEGVDLDDGRTAPAKVAVVRESEGNTWISLTIHEGRNRQVRRMCEAVSLAVVRLKRVRYGVLSLGELKTGEFRLLTREESDRLAGREKSAPAKPAGKGPRDAKGVGRKTGAPSTPRTAPSSAGSSRPSSPARSRKSPLSSRTRGR